ncbi:Re/Si-specific NAD(P)(+) transhydrogenase subunit alpha [Dendronalium sp. ChiSLP03b]|uniref:Re/Si-specific NAD(P)(+) transhydrogenase subunit alpha n=1 Tax=Dendronalium sp. ChiSLP03b TaxID=3075381 RepID=UPI002AD49F53|nr:Re/Si-specific NAD(P)(+) transhydrogenase subunit alpha [Dendronalium sp. ChiSLP03b]MDZ8208373.1 Re/Si-specific NAD(P)(+) transhydrogenase subunit alpha [Dendronalium sp. ChiSLP03b]
MKVGIPKEVYPGERRVAATPDTAKRLIKLGFDVLVESGAGASANFADEAYMQAECTIVSDASTLWTEADIVLKVRPPEMHPEIGKHETQLLREGGTQIGFIWPSQNPDLLEKLVARKATVLAMDAVPRITRAQKMDALSSMANLAGYRAVIEAANHFGRFFNGQITAAGKVPPAKVLVIGAGVAGLAAIGTARSLGAIVRGFDTRLVVKEQVESLGAEFLELNFAEDGTGEGGYAKVMSDEFIKAEMELFAAQAQEVDIIITTALIPGKKAPVLVTQEMVESMNEGSVIVDMAAEQGGNCACTHPGEVYSYKGVTIVGLTDLPSRMAQQASQLYGINLYHILEEMGGAKDYKVDRENEVIRGALVVHDGEITWPPPKKAREQEKQGEQGKQGEQEKQREQGSRGAGEDIENIPASPRPRVSASSYLPWLLIGLALVGIGISAPASFLSHLIVFVLACFVGWQAIWNVKPALHTPLMSVTNAISGIIIIGGMLQIYGVSSLSTILGAIAILVGTINISGGFLVTQRMLRMFQK